MTDITLFEVGPRDGFQNEKKQIATDDKIRLVNMLSECGFSRIEVTSFVSPKWVPQMKDAAEVMTGIRRAPEISYAVLTPNLRGFEGALQVKPSEVAIFGSASEGFSQANINCSIAESLVRFMPVMEAAKAANIPVRGYVSCVIKCPYDGDVKPADVAMIAKKLLEMGCYQISLGDTIGAGTPEKVTTMLEAVLQVVPAGKLAGHVHDTGGRAVDNIEGSIKCGLRVFDTAIGGLGGCPYAPGSAGNVATEKVAKRLANLGFQTGLEMDKLYQVSDFAKGLRS